MTSRAPRMSEAAFQALVIELAQHRGWVVAHFRPAIVGGRHMTPVAADGAGFPDLCMAHRHHGVIFAELKAARGRLSVDQQLWQAVLTAAGARHHVWRAGVTTLPEIDRILTGREVTA